MKILITGGAGFIGANLVYRLEKEGHSIAVLDNLSTGKLENLSKASAKFYLTDICSAEADKIFEIEKPEIVVHLAAQASVIASVEDPVLDARINIMGLLNLLNACVKHKTRKIIFTSTGGAIYGDATVIPTDETYVPEVISPYALTKQASENYLRIFKNLYNLDYSVLRLANVYGPMQIPKGECGVIPIYFDKCLNSNEAALYTYSDMPDGTTRDYVYVDDVCEAVALCFENGSGEIFNIGTGREIYTRRVFDKVKELTCSACELKVMGERTGDVRRGVLDVKKAGKILGWAPKVCFEEGMKRTADWAKKGC